MTAEEWRPIPWANGRYEVSDMGRVRSTSLVRLSGTPLRPKRESASGYMCVEVRPTPGQIRNVRIHRLVLEAFVGLRPEGRVARHLNGNPEDNRLGNLAWGTQMQNADDTRRHGTHNNTRKTHCKSGHEFNDENTFRDCKGKRKCRTCQRGYERARDARRRQAAA